MKLEKAPPLYLRLKELLEEYIRHERPAILPAEKDLMEQYGVSRKTVRSAIAELVKAGSVTPMAGKGTIVNRRPSSSNPLILLDDFAILPPYLYEIYTAVKTGLDQAGLPPSVLLINPHEPDLVTQLEAVCSSAEAVLLFSAAANRNDIFQLLGNRKTMSVGYIPQQKFHTVFPDVYDGFGKVVQHLISCGHRRIAAAALRRDSDRYRAFRDTLDQAGINPDSALWQEASGTRLDGYNAAATLNKNHEITAVIAHNDFCALGIMEYCLQHRIAIPGGLSIAGCDNIADARNFPVPLTTVGHDLDCYRRSVLTFLSGAAPPKVIKQKIPMQLVIRKSVQEITGENTL